MASNILEIRDLVNVASGHTIIDHLGLEIEEGELRVLVGPNGAGKTTLIDVITGRFKPTSGQIMFRGRSIGGRPRHEIYAAGISRKFQVPTVYDNLTVFENMSVGLRGHRKVFSSLTYRITPKAAAQIEEVLARINLLARAGDEAHTLSHGEKQWLEIGPAALSPRRADDRDDARRDDQNCRAHPGHCPAADGDGRRTRHELCSENREQDHGDASREKAHRRVGSRGREPSEGGRSVPREAEDQ